MFGENAERRKAAPISSAMEWKTFLKTSRSMAFGKGLFLAMARRTFREPGEMDLSVGVDTCSPVCGNQRCGAVFRDDGWTNELVAVTKNLAIVKRHFPPFSR